MTARSIQKRPLIQVIIGPRQVGKTTAATALYEGWPGSKISISADLPSNQGAEFIESQWLRARSLPEPCLLIVDEVQKITHWAESVKSLFDHDRDKKDIRVFLLGSASLSVQAGLT